MPLMQGKSPKAFTHNLKAEMHAGKPQNQSLAIAYAVKRRARKAAGGYMAEGGQLTKAGYQSETCDMTQPDLADHEMDNLSLAHQAAAMKHDAAATAEDDRLLNQHGDDEEGPQHPRMAEGGMTPYDDSEDEEQGDAGSGSIGSFNADNYADEEDGDGRDMVGRIMKKRQQTFSEGGRVANEDHGHDDEDLAGFDANEFDDLSLRDDLESSYTGANSGDEDGNARTAHDQEDDVARIMRLRKQRRQHNPNPA